MSDPASKTRRWRVVIGAVLLTVFAFVAIGELSGWPFLAAPLQRLLSSTLERDVVLSSNEAGVPARPFRVRFIGGIRLRSGHLEVGPPVWSEAPHMVLARDIALDLRYLDLWRAWRGQAFRIENLSAATLDVRLERQADGRASWQFGSKPTAQSAEAKPAPIPSFGHLQVGEGTLSINDAISRLALDAQLSVRDGSGGTTPDKPANTLLVKGTGRYRDQPLKIDLASSGVLALAADDAGTTSVPLTLDITVGRAGLAFKGSAVDALNLGGLKGHFILKGPSLAAVGDAVSVTLPTTPEFRMEGTITKKDRTWHAQIDDATIGSSSLTGDFTYEKARRIATLTGKLGGSRLMLSDLGPAVGTTPKAVSSTEPAPTTDAPGDAAKVLPDRPFDLAALRVMDADIAIDISTVDLNTKILQPLQPLRGHLQLAAGVLTIKDLDARTAQGRLMGDVSLDGRGSEALWKTDLRWDGVKLEQWLKLERANGAPPYISGTLSGRAALNGKGRSTAEILAGLEGKVRTELHDGGISHFVVEIAGLDLAQGLGMLIKGDDVLPVSCAVADLTVQNGGFSPRVMVIDTTDSAIWVDGSVSLASEALDLRAVVMPKDFSVLTLRAPLRVRGSFAKPDVSLEQRLMGQNPATQFLLKLVNPIAALIPFIDTGSTAEAKASAAACEALTERSKARLASAATAH